MTTPLLLRAAEIIEDAMPDSLQSYQENIDIARQLRERHSVGDKPMTNETKQDEVKGRRVALFYGSARPSWDADIIGIPGVGQYYIRAQLFDPGTTLAEALDSANPQSGETVLNSVYVTDAT